MRSIRRLLALAALSGVATLAGAAAAVQPPLMPDPVCEAARGALVWSMDASPPVRVLDDAADRGTPPDWSPEMLLELGEWHGKAPPRLLVIRYIGANPRPVLTHCAWLATAAKELGVTGVGHDAAAALGEARGPDGRPLDQWAGSALRLSLPVVAGDGQSAIVATGVQCGPRCGRGSLLYLERQADGVWKVVGSRRTWMS